MSILSRRDHLVSGSALAATASVGLAMPGWGIDDNGMATYATIAKHTPDFFIRSGDTIYADGPMKDEVKLKDGSVWEEYVSDR